MDKLVIKERLEVLEAVEYNICNRLRVCKSPQYSRQHIATLRRQAAELLETANRLECALDYDLANTVELIARRNCVRAEKQLLLALLDGANVVELVSEFLNKGE